MEPINEPGPRAVKGRLATGSPKWRYVRRQKAGPFSFSKSCYRRPEYYTRNPNKAKPARNGNIGSRESRSCWLKA
jgi:hypothetical protein